jgi:hypothetical protein
MSTTVLLRSLPEHCLRQRRELLSTGDHHGFRIQRGFEVQ